MKQCESRKLFTAVVVWTKLKTKNGETVPQNEELIKSENPQTIHVNAQNVLNHIVVTS